MPQRSKDICTGIFGNVHPFHVTGRWMKRMSRSHLYRTVDKEGNTINFYPSPTCNAKASKGFPGKTINGLKGWDKPLKINTDKTPSYEKAIAQLKDEEKCLKETIRHQVKYLNNIVESDHDKLKRLIKPTLGFKSMKIAHATLKGFEVMYALRKG
jgi:transposase, IS6 family